MSAPQPTITFGQAIEIRWLQNQPGQPVPCDPNTVRPEHTGAVDHCREQ